MKKLLPIIIIVVLVIIGAVYFASKNSTNTQDTHMMGNGQMMNSNSMQGMNHGSQKIIQSHRSYSLQLTSSISKLQPNKQTTITYKIVDEQGNVLKDFALDHTKLMHFIIVRKDLQDFQHIHPDFNKNTGEFSISVTFRDNGVYRLFADFTPANGQKDAQGDILSVTPYKDVSVGDIAKYTAQAVAPDTQATKTVGDFHITYTLSQPIKVNKSITITAHVTKNGERVTDMQEYLGALAHGILLKKDSLDFAHLHDMGQMDNGSMQGMSIHEMNTGNAKITNTGPDITFTYTFPSSGVYRLFTQFQEQGKVVTSDYTMNVE